MYASERDLLEAPIVKTCSRFYNLPIHRRIDNGQLVIHSVTLYRTLIVFGLLKESVSHHDWERAFPLTVILNAPWIPALFAAGYIWSAFGATIIGVELVDWLKGGDDFEDPLFPLD
jgi:hypothetical protein